MRSTYRCTSSTAYRLLFNEDTYHLGHELLDVASPKKLHASNDLAVQDIDGLYNTFFAIGLVTTDVNGANKCGASPGELTLWAYRKGRPKPTAFAPRQSALRTSNDVSAITWANV